MNNLDPLAIPLRGLALIEASAGTGKTYSIATLYLRLLLERGLEVDRILVVTFTEAATEELRERIRKRLIRALDWLRGDVETGADQDPTLADLLRAQSNPERARAVLADALTRMDEAAIFTIHGFCLRTLQDQAFESGAAFEVEFITDETRLREDAAEDFWRLRVASATLEQARWVRRHWRTPRCLLADLGHTLTLDDLRLLPRIDEGMLEDRARELSLVLEQLRDQWRTSAPELAAILMDRSVLNARSYTKQVVQRAIRAAETLVGSDSPPDALPPGFERLTPAALQRGTKADQTPPTHPFFELCQRYQDLLQRHAAGTKALFLSTARDFVRRALDRRKRAEGLMYFDDLLRRLDQALSAHGGAALAAAVRARYPVALIDEFQDTDAQQYRIFRHIYGGHPDCGLFLIGDPKQAIYAFRGADIFTYMTAREHCDLEGRRYALGVNWRSGSRLIAAVNCLFGTAHRPFIYEPHIAFEPVAASPEADAEPLRIEDTEPVPLQLWMLQCDEANETSRPPGFIRTDAALAIAARACAESIAHLLNLAAGQRATIGDDPLHPGDIALLVRTHREGDLVQQALGACAIRSVSISEDSIFATEDARELAILLEALVEIRDEGRLRAALATSLLGIGAGELERLGADDSAWEGILARFQAYRERWRRQGIMAAMQALLCAERIPARLLRRPDGERRLSNLLQLLELLQLAASEHPGMDTLLRWLDERRTADERDPARQLRLESDQGLVKVLTLHKCKGLEYPLVFIPFPWSYFRAPRDSAATLFHAPQDRQAYLDLGSNEQARHRALERTERLAERLRLLYVGITRAAKLCVLCWGKVNAGEDSALAYLLHRDPDSQVPASRMRRMSEQQIRTDLERLANRAPEAIQVRELPSPSAERLATAEVPDREPMPQQFIGAIAGSWRIASYSALVRGDDPERPDHDAAAVPSPPRNDREEATDPLFELPAGTHFGHFLHQLLEHLDFPQASGEPLRELVRALLDRYGGLGPVPEGERRPEWIPSLERLVSNVLDTWLDAAESIRLRDLEAADRIAELEFHFPVSRLNPRALADTLDRFPDHAGSAEGLSFEPMRGLMRGFIDLVFRRDGRFYVLDYKSNRLGVRLADYGHAGLRAAVREHRYNLQYLIYALALQRFLRRRLPSYHYERHFGGVYYLFVRGMRPEHGSRYGVWYDRPPRRLIAALDRLFDGESGAS